MKWKLIEEEPIPTTTVGEIICRKVNLPKGSRKKTSWAWLELPELSDPFYADEKDFHVTNIFPESLGVIDASEG